MLKIGICDDDMITLKNEKQIVSNYFNNRKINADIITYNNITDLINDLSTLSILFLDIEIGDVNRIDVVKEINKYVVDLSIIFVSNYDKYFINAFGVHAFDYIIKPMNHENTFKVLNELFQMKPNLLNKESTMIFKTERGLLEFNLHEIIFFERNVRKVFLTTEQKQYRIIHDFKTIKEQMIKYGFYTPHKSFVINLSQINSFKNYEIYMKNGSIIPLSQKKSAEFRKIYNAFLISYKHTY